MSVKIMAMVWDLRLESNKKFVLLAYADNANHEGGNIWPAVETVSGKTGYHERSVQRITKELEQEGYLVPDGQGPKGTNKWKIPLNEGGDKIAPVTNEAATGDIPSGDIPSGDKIAPKQKTVRKPSVKEGASAPKQRPPKEQKQKLTDIPELVVYREVVRHWPKQAQRDIVIKAVQKINGRLGRAAVKEDLDKFWLAWNKVSGNEWSLVWLDWAVSGNIPTNGNGHKPSVQQSYDAIDRVLGV